MTSLTPWIINVAASDISAGLHRDPGPNSMLISIVDPGSWRPTPKHSFKEQHNFEFLDIEATDECFEESWRVSDADAEQLVSLLKRALSENINVIVHCFVGICRSGAVCEVGVTMGFQDEFTYRIPNTLVKSKMLKVLEGGLNLC